MEKLFVLVAEYSKEHGISATIPVFAYIVFKVAKEDLNERMNNTKDATAQNHDDIEALELELKAQSIEMASLKSTVEALKWEVRRG